MRALLSAVCLTACAATAQEKARSGNLNGAAQAAALEAGEAAKKLNAAKEAADATCEAVKTREVAWPELHAMGELYVDAALRDTRGLYLDAPAEAPGAGAQALPSGEKNDVTAYVQLVGATLTRDTPGHWTFGVVDADPPEARAYPGDVVLINTGLLKRLENEAELAAVLAHEISHVTNGYVLERYRNALVSACRINVTGFNVMVAGSANVAGGEDFVNNSKFARAMQKAGATAPLDPSDPESQFTVQGVVRVLTLDLQGRAPDEVEQPADAAAVELLGAAGYDTRALSAVVQRLDANPSSRRVYVLGLKEKPGKKSGQAPAFPPGLVWPR